MGAPPSCLFDTWRNRFGWRLWLLHRRLRRSLWRLIDFYVLSFIPHFFLLLVWGGEEVLRSLSPLPTLVAVGFEPTNPSSGPPGPEGVCTTTAELPSAD